MLIWAGTGPICYNITTSEMIERGYLARPHIDFLEIEPMAFSKKLKYQDIYRIAIVHNEERNTKIALKAIELSDTGKVYIHVKRVAHGEQLTYLINELLPSDAKPAEFIYGEDTTETRKKVINAFRNKDLKILVSTLLGEGVDLPEMYALILASGGLSRTFVQQVFGRLLRISQHKEVEFIDCRDACKFLYDHFIERVRYYKSEPSFVLSPKLEAIDVPDGEE
jgi:superfamily II DNA or RNA helicase